MPGPYFDAVGGAVVRAEQTEYEQLKAQVALAADLVIGAKSLRLTLSAGVGSVPIPDTARLVGIKPVNSTDIRVGLEAPEANGTATGAAVAADLKKGIPVDAAVWTWFVLPTGTGRVFHVKGGPSDQSDVAVL